MSVYSQLVALALAGLSLTTGCTSVCDKDGLQRAAEAFNKTGGADRQAGLAALREACPTLPPVLGQSLADAQSPEEAGQLRRARGEDPTWRGLLAHTCQPMTPPTTPIVLEELEQDVRRYCDLGRYELQVPEATFVRQDVVVFMLHEWLLAGRVGRAHASEVTRPLLTSSVLAAQDLAPPLGSIDLPPADGPELRISPTTLSVDGAPVLTLVNGRAPAAAFDHHVAPALQTIFTEISRRAREQADRTGVPWSWNISILADRATPMITVVDSMYTASKVGIFSFELLVHDGDELRAQPISAPYSWLPPSDEIREERPLKLQFEVHGDSVVASTDSERDPSGHENLGTRYNRTACTSRSEDCRDMADLAEYLLKLKNLYPREVVARFHVAGDVTVQALVSLMDLARGEGCALLGPVIKGQKLPDECLFWQAVVDLEPSLGRPEPAEAAAN